MKSIKKVAILTSFSFVFIWWLNSSFQSPYELSKEEAIIIAEQFIIENGYTDLPADSTKLSFELLDRLVNDIDSVLFRRKNTLNKKAFCFSEDVDRWDIGFITSRIDIKALDEKKRQSDLAGRAVIVMKNGGGVRMAHKQPLFFTF